MRDLAVLTFLTLDGVMQAPAQPEEDPSGGFIHGGWSVDYREEVMEQVTKEAMATPYDLLLGRKTYEIFAAHWPSAGDNPQIDAHRIRGVATVVDVPRHPFGVDGQPQARRPPTTGAASARHDRYSVKRLSLGSPSGT